MSTLTIAAVDARAQREFRLLLAAPEIVVTSFVPAQRHEHALVPTLASVERVVGSLARVGLALAREDELAKIASVINSHFLRVPADRWCDAALAVNVHLLQGSASVEAAGAVAGLRVPTLDAVSPILLAEARRNARQRREAEGQLVEALSTSVCDNRRVWEERSALAFRLIGRTVLSGLAAQLIGVPLADLIRTGVRGTLLRL